MGKTVFMFPGQGAQYVGMGKEFYESFPVCREVFEESSRVTGLDIAELCFADEEKIHITEYTQIAMLTVSAAILAAIEEAGLGHMAEAYAGLSLGEYGALIGSGALNREDAFRLVRKRGILMQQAVPEGGAMTAILGLDGETVSAICKAVCQTDGQVSVANYNCPGQIVITGEAAAVSQAAERLKAAGAKRCIPLKVSGPFHSPLLKAAGEGLAQELESVEIHPIQTPYVTNVTARYVTDETQVKSLLARQVASSVLWQQSVERLAEDGFTRFVEIGPGRTLTGFLRKIDRSLTGVNIERPEDLDKLKESVNQ